MTSDQSRHLVRRYLLGDLTGADQQGFEENLMTGDTSLEEMEAAEDDLVDEYLAGKLTRDEQAQFEQHFLSTPEREQKLRFAKVFHRYAASSQRQTRLHSKRSISVFSLQTWSARIAALGLVVIVVGGIWLYSRSRQTQPSLATITLSLSSSNRADSAEVARVKLPLNANSLRVVLKLPAGPRAESYRADLENQAGETTTTTLTEENSSSLAIAIPATQLQRGQYAVKLFAKNAAGVEQRVAGSYFFTVE